jgi:hypothetical protein
VQEQIMQVAVPFYLSYAQNSPDQMAGVQFSA